MKRRNTKKTNEKRCQMPQISGAVRQDQLLVAGLMVIIIVSALVIGSVLLSWKKQGLRDINRPYESTIQNLQTRISLLEKQAARDKAGKTAGNASQNAPAAQNASEDFENAVNAGDFKKIEALMADNVYYVVDASDCCGDISKKEAVDHFKNYIRGAKSFDFDQEQQVVKQMKVNLAGTFAKYTIGIAGNKMVLSYMTNKQGKVNNVMLSASHVMYDLE